MYGWCLRLLVVSGVPGDVQLPLAEAIHEAPGSEGRSRAHAGPSSAPHLWKAGG